MLVAGKLLFVGALAFIMLTHTSVINAGKPRDDDEDEISTDSTEVISISKEEEDNNSIFNFTTDFTTDFKTFLTNSTTSLAMNTTTNPLLKCTKIAEVDMLSQLFVKEKEKKDTCIGNYCYWIMTYDDKTKTVLLEAGCLEERNVSNIMPCFSVDETNGKGWAEIVFGTKKFEKDVKFLTACINYNPELALPVPDLPDNLCHSYSSISDDLPENEIDSKILAEKRCITGGFDDRKNIECYSAVGQDGAKNSLFGGCLDKEKRCEDIKKEDGGCTKKKEQIHKFFKDMNVKGMDHITELCCCERTECNKNIVPFKQNCYQYKNVNLFDESAIKLANNICEGEFCYKVVLQMDINNTHYATGGCLSKEEIIDLDLTDICKSKDDIKNMNKAEKKAAVLWGANLTTEKNDKTNDKYKEFCITKGANSNKLSFENFEKTCYQYSFEGNDTVEKKVKTESKCKTNNLDDKDEATCYYALYQTPDGNINKQVGGCVEKAKYCKLEKCLYVADMTDGDEDKDTKKPKLPGVTDYYPDMVCCCKGTNCNGERLTKPTPQPTTTGAATSTISLVLLIIGLHAHHISELLGSVFSFVIPEITN